MKIDNFNLNSSVKETLLSYSADSLFPQTMLIEGADTEKRTELARFIANLILCTSDREKPCGVCSACIKCKALSNPDVREYGEEKAGAVFKVDTAREIRSDAFVIPNDSDRKVYIIKETQNMNDAAQNAMLKILEEPPHFDYFILTADSRGAMLDTILSRAVVLSLGEAVPSFSDGVKSCCKELAVALCKRSRFAVTEALAAVYNDKQIFEEFCDCTEEMLVGALKLKKTGAADGVTPECERLALSLDDDELYRLFEAVKQAHSQFKQNANYNILITYMSVRLWGAIE